MIDKNQAVVDYLIQCPQILNSPLYFNFINAKDDTNQFLTVSSDRYSNTSFIDGSVEKIYTFTIITYKSAADIAVVKIEGFSNENISDMSDIQALIDWVKDQDDIHNYPNFGEDCIVDSIRPTTDNPNFDGIDEQISPPLAVYSTSFEIRYIDVSKKLWR